MARVLFLDPYHGPSHRALSAAIRGSSRHQVTLATLPARKWKWRMRGAALAFEPMVRALTEPPEILVSTDMLNLPELLAVARDALPPRLPVITYFHENQLTYPLSPADERDFHFGLANLYTALGSDRVVFNSAYHREEFLGAVVSMLKLMPDHRPEGVPGRIRGRSDVLGPPLDLPPGERPAWGARGRTILWNHRWEEDKNPAAFFDALRALDRRGAGFRVVVLGQTFRERPACFDQAGRDLAHRIETWGYLPSRPEYFDALARCRVVVSTARHEFFGLAVREAIASGCAPLLPRRVVYPEMVAGRGQFLYDTPGELVDRLEALLSADAPPPELEPLRAEIASHTVARVVGVWDSWFDRLAAGRAPA